MTLSIGRRAPMWLRAALFASIVGLMVAPAAQGATVNATWAAKVGSAGANGTARVDGYATGTGALILGLKALARSSTYPVSLYRGTCSRLGTRIVAFSSQLTTTTGTLSRTLSISKTTTSTIRAATKGTGRMSLVVGSGSLRRCGTFAATALPTPTPTPTPVPPCGPPDLCLGQSLIVGKLTVTVLEVQPWAGTPSLQPLAGHVFVTVRVRVGIRVDEVTDAVYYSGLDWRVHTVNLAWYSDKLGAVREPALVPGWAYHGNVYLDRPLEGWVTFEVPASQSAQLWFVGLDGFQYRLF
jgi:hypothetical protein